MLALDPDAHRHGARLHSHAHAGAHRHLTLPQRSAPAAPRRAHEHSHHHGSSEGAGAHSHGLIDESIKRSREGIRAVSLSLAVLGVAGIAQTVVVAVCGSIALLAGA